MLEGCRTRDRSAPLAALTQTLAAWGRKPELAGQLGGALYLIGGLTLALFVVLPGITHAHTALLLAIAAVECGWGVCSIVAIDWAAVPRWLVHLSSGGSLPLIAVAIASSGGARSPAWMYLLFVIVFAGYFYRPAVAIAYIAACAGIHALPLLYDPPALDHGFVARLLIATPAYLALGVAILAGKQVMGTMRWRAEQLAREQGALRRVATAVVGGGSPEGIYQLVARETGWLLEADAAGILRIESPRQTVVMGSWSEREGGRYEPGTVVPIRAGSDLEQLLQTGLPVRVNDHAPESPVARLGYGSSILAPIRVGNALWGALAITAAGHGELTADDERMLGEFGDLLATAITSIEDRAKLAAQASSDPLTGLANGRTLRERLAGEAARAARNEQPLSVAVIDIDHFKQINDIGGHEIGDEMLILVARCLERLARAHDVLGRTGGDEFVWVLPDTTSEQAIDAVERVRHAIASEVPRPHRMSVSAGICDTAITVDPAELLNYADRALYWSKGHGRNRAWVYDRAALGDLSDQDRARRLERSRALAGLRVLARMVDARAGAGEHSERVAELAGRLARAAGWSPERALLLSEAALVHDVGKIAVADEALRKASGQTPQEQLQLRDHPELGARIVADLLAPEQVEWIRAQCERPDGRGEPRGLREVSDGAALLALADA
ncbi:MAG: diguanylate cyclase, partial [Solirubrobacterales bacterium]|nr:diguanylate cyclase [Solirubrobacterales bacterium]